LIYSEAFDALAEPVRDYILRRLHTVLTERDHTRDFDHLSSADRQAILEILLDTKPSLPEYWRQRN
jgi:hypothetical protein